MVDNVLVKCETDKEVYSIARGIEKIADSAFYDKGNLRRINLSDDVDWIGDYAFKLCYKLKNIKLPDKVEHFGIGVFQQCHRLEAVKLPKGVQVIDAGMFVSCNSLKELWIPATVEYIELGSLAHCVNLEFIAAPASVFELIPDNKKLIAAVTYLEQTYYAGRAEREGLIAEGGKVYEYISDNLDDVVKSIIEGEKAFILNDMLEYIEFDFREYNHILDIVMDLGRDDLSSVIIERKLRAAPSANDIFDDDPFA